MFLKSNNPCPDPECPYCALHCPYCGTTDLVLDPERRRMGCPACGVNEVLPTPEDIELRHRQVLALTAHTIHEWKARARQLAARFHWRWRTALCYLDPVAAALMVVSDRLMIDGMDYEAAIAQAKSQADDLCRYVAENPEQNAEWLTEGDAFIDDWL